MKTFTDIIKKPSEGLAKLLVSTATCSLVVLGSAMQTLGAIVPEGTQYQIAGSTIGDQVAPCVAIRPGGGWIAWQDNSTDGDGLGISARRLSGQLTGLSSFRLNEMGSGDQENPQVGMLADGSAIFVWQSGPRGAQKIVGRIVKSDGRFLGSEFTVSGSGNDNKDASVAVSKDGTILIVWAAEGVDGQMLGVQAARFSSNGTQLEAPFVVNQYSQFNQRSPAAVALSDNSFVVVWVSEHQRQQNSVDIIGRAIQSTGVPTRDEFIINTAKYPCATPALASLSNGRVYVAWSEHSTDVPGAVWDVQGRILGPNGPEGESALVNSKRAGFQGFPKLASTGNRVLVVYRSDDGDGAGAGILGQWVDGAGGHVGTEFVVNSVVAGDQMHPAVGAEGSGRALVTWSTFGGISKGMDLAAQRFVDDTAGLIAPSSPFVFSTSSSKLLVTWAELSGLPIKQYELRFDGSLVSIPAGVGSYIISGLAPKSEHVLSLSYTLLDGNTSQESTSVKAVTWGEDDNADGLPDDWQALNFGSDPALWPSPSQDSDLDGVSNKDEFLAGTDPKSPTSVLKVNLVHSSQGDILNWNTRAGAIYQVQTSYDLVSWVNLGAPRFSAGENDSIPVGDMPSNSYYRVNLLR